MNFKKLVFCFEKIKFNGLLCHILTFITIHKYFYTNIYFRTDFLLLLLLLLLLIKGYIGLNNKVKKTFIFYLFIIARNTIFLKTLN